jgi:heat shock protein HslJ
MSQLSGCARTYGRVVSSVVLSITLGAMPTIAAQTRTQAPEQVRFGEGKTSAVRKGTVRGYATRDYEIRAAEGQRMSVKLDSRSTFLYFNVLDKGTMVALETDPPPREVTEWSGVLPKTGAYVVRVYLVRAEARRNRRAPYALTVSLKDAQAGGASSVRFSCDGNAEVAATFIEADPPTARVELGDKSWTLPLVPSASGSKYSDGTVTLWTKGSEALFESPGLEVSCVAVDSAATTAANLEAAEWGLVSLTRDGARTEAPAGVSVTATFRNGRVAGKGVCNSYFASYTVSSSSLAIGDVGATRMMCPRNSDFESAYFENLSRAQRFTINGDTLLLTTPTGSLVFARRT